MNILNSLYKTTLSLCIILCFISCEETWDYSYGEKNRVNVVIVAFADSLIYGGGWAIPDRLNPDIHTGLGDGNRSIVGQSQAYFSVNGGERIKFEKKEGSDIYSGDRVFSYLYDFKAGDKIDLDLRCGTTYTPITASVVMPDKPEIEAECIGYEIGLSQKGYSDSLMIVKLKIKDNSRKENFYMLNVASYSVKLVDVKYNKFPDNIIQRNDSIMHTWGGTDYFLSAEPILIGKQAESPENISAKELIHPLFDDATFNGKNYECIIKCKVPQYALPEMGDITATFVKERKLLENKRYTVIRLDELSEDYYKYLKHAETKDRTALPVSNINGGYGVLGAVNRSEIIRLDVK